MKFMFILTQVESAWPEAPAGEAERIYEEYMALEKELKAKGKFIDSVRLKPVSEAITLRNFPKGKRVQTNSAFVQSKDNIGGFYILECASMEEALQWAGRMPNYGHGAIEIRPVWE